MGLNTLAAKQPAAKAAEDRLATFTTFFENAPVAMLLVDEHRQVSEMNRAAEGMFGLSSLRFEGRAVGDSIGCFHTLDVPRGCGTGPDCQMCLLRQIVVDTFATGETARRVEAKLVLQHQLDPVEKYVLVSASLSEGSDRRQVLVCVEDITERKRAEIQLREANAKIRKLRDDLRVENAYLREEIEGSRGFEAIVGQSEEIRKTIRRTKDVAGTDANVLLIGETGTGKELFARAIHNASARRERPLVKVNCASLPPSLIESELFGHVMGAFTGAVSDKMGRFEMADRGTIFLDEIGELSPELQTKLLQVLQDSEFERVGSSTTLKVDVRVIAATNRDLRAAMKEAHFRPDLYYRLAIFPIELPPLRARRSDIPNLVWHFIAEKQATLRKTIRDISEETMRSLVEYAWPGNIRELENLVERAMILSSGPSLVLDSALGKMSDSPRSYGNSSSLEDVDRVHILGVLEDCDWRIKGANGAADRLGLHPSTLRHRMKKLGIQRPPRRPR